MRAEHSSRSRAARLARERASTDDPSIVPRGSSFPVARNAAVSASSGPAAAAEAESSSRYTDASAELVTMRATAGVSCNARCRHKHAYCLFSCASSTIRMRDSSSRSIERRRLAIARRSENRQERGGTADALGLPGAGTASHACADAARLEAMRSSSTCSAASICEGPRRRQESC